MSLNITVTYHFSTSVRKTFWWLVVITLVMSVLIIFFRLPDFYSEEPMAALFRLAVISSFPLTVFFRLIFVIRPYIYASYAPRQTHLLIIRGSKEQRIDYGQIEVVRPSWLPMALGGGFVYKLKSGLKIRVFSLIDGHEKIIEDYINYLPENLVPKSLTRYRLKSENIAHQRARILEVFSKWRVVLPLYLGSPPLLAGVLHLNGRGLFADFATNLVICYIFAFLVAILIWSLEEFFLSTFFSGARKKAVERGICYFSRFLYLVTLICMGWYFQ